MSVHARNKRLQRHVRTLEEELKIRDDKIEAQKDLANAQSGLMNLNNAMLEERAKEIAKLQFKYRRLLAWTMDLSTLRGEEYDEAVENFKAWMRYGDYEEETKEGTDSSGGEGEGKTPGKGKGC